MQIIRNELSIAAQAGALDGALAFTTVYNTNRDLIAQTAIMGLRGVQTMLSETGIYGEAMGAMRDVTNKIYVANAEAAKDPFVSDPSNRADTAVDNGRHSQSTALNGMISSAQSQAATARDATIAGTPERTAADAVVAAANGVANANSAIYNGDPSQVQTAFSNAVSAQNAASAAVDRAQQDYDSTPAIAKQAALNRLNAANAVYDASSTTVAAAQKLLDLHNAPIGQICGVRPTKSDLGNGYTLSTWGSTGYTTITDSTGKGVIISPGGSVDPLDGADKGWQFNNTSTFVLPGDTKVTIHPGNTANILVSRGVHAFTVSNLGSGQTPAFSDYQGLNGRNVDRASNDGHIINFNGDAAHWTMNGSVLGNTGSREQVATSLLTNELKLDPTDVAVDPATTALLARLGIAGSDYDSDGKFNNVELATIATQLQSFVKTLQDQYEQALARLSAANQALNDLNTLLELIRKQTTKDIDNRTSEAASAKAELQAVEKRLLLALELLNGSGNAPAAPLAAGIEGGAEQVLQQLTSITQQGGVQSVQSAASVPTSAPQTTSNNIETLGRPVASNGSDTLGNSLRRAERLLSGLLGGASLNTLELPPAAQAALPSLGGLGASLAALVTGLNAQPGALPQAALTGQDLGAGLEGLLTALAKSGLIDGAILQKGMGAEELLQSLMQNAGAQTPASAASVLGFLGTLAQFGSALQALAPQAEPLKQVLQGLAEIGTAGSGQSMTNADLSKGLQAFLSALLALGLFSHTGQQVQGSASSSTFGADNRQASSTISGNFATDPELLKVIEANLSKALQVQTQQQHQASTLFVQSQEIVQKFVDIVKHDDLVHDVVKSDDLSDEQQALFDDRMNDLRKDLGIDWGGPEENRTPAGQANLGTRAVQSGLMV